MIVINSQGAEELKQGTNFVLTMLIFKDREKCLGAFQFLVNEQVLYPNILEVNRSCNFGCCLLAKATACQEGPFCFV